MRSRVYFVKPITMESPSGEVTVTLEGLRGRKRWVLQVRDLFEHGRSYEQLPDAMLDCARRLRDAGVGEPAGELERLALVWAAPSG